MTYAELQVTSNFSFLQGASHAEELVGQSVALGLSAVAVTDRNSVAGVVRAHRAAKNAKLQLVVGARVGMAEHFVAVLHTGCRVLRLEEGRWGLNPWLRKNVKPPVVPRNNDRGD